MQTKVSNDGILCQKDAANFCCSNTAGDVIARATLDAWKDGIDRSKVRLNDMERVIELGSFNEKGESRFALRCTEILNGWKQVIFSFL
ncbi:hypothetical protein HPB47_028244 [Ixodes persulcatus]|uniref:Uncharacterized protein n=1 Tax=Ixodes persulcatus TaxID=34615 RepID=A0AC60PUA3_IXOPE|nr:hypothetical protein HPB47_028244 [Ixodes persulcatus]